MVSTIGYIINKVNIEEVANYLKSIEGIKNVQINKDYCINFIHLKDMEEYSEPRSLSISEYDDIDEEEIEYYKDYNINIEKFKNGYTLLSLGSWGSSIEIMFDMLVHFGGGYITPNDEIEKSYYVDKNSNRKEIYLWGTAY